MRFSLNIQQVGSQVWLNDSLICAVPQSPMLRRAQSLVSWAAVTILKGLLISSLNLCFESKIQGNSGTCKWAEEYTIRVCHSRTLFARHVGSAPWTQSSSGPTVRGSSEKLKVSTSMWCWWLRKEVRKGTDSPGSPGRTCFPFKLELTTNPERRQWYSKKHKQGTSSHLSLAELLPCINKSLTLKMIA